MKTTLKIVAAVAAIILVIFLISGRFKTTVQTAPVIRDTAINAVPGNVTVETAQRMTLRTQEEGLITKTRLQPGDASAKLKAGDLVASIDTRMLDLQLESIEADLQLLQQRLTKGSPKELTLANLKQDRRKNEELLKLNQFTQDEFNKLVRNIESIEREIATERLEWQTLIKQLQTQAEQIKLRRERMSLRSPIDGQLTEMLAFPGDYLSAGDPVASIHSDSFLIRVSISEEDFEEIAVGKSALIKFQGFGDRTFPGTVSHLSDSFDAQSRRRDAFVQLDTLPENGLVDGMTGEASIVKARRENALIIPRRALLGDTVYVVEDSTVALRTVEPGFTGLLHAEILSGLEEGEIVITDGLLHLSEGQEVVAEKSGK